MRTRSSSPRGPAFAADPARTWLTEEGKATVRIADCGRALCGTIVALKEPSDPQTGNPKVDRDMRYRAR